MQSLVKVKKGATMGLYKDLESEEKTQKQKKEFIFKKDKRLTFIDTVVKNKKVIPGIGKYDKVEYGFTRLSNGPRSMTR